MFVIFIEMIFILGCVLLFDDYVVMMLFLSALLQTVPHELPQT